MEKFLSITNMVVHEIETLVDRLCQRPFSDLCTTNNVLKIFKKNQNTKSKIPKINVLEKKILEITSCICE